VRYVERSFSQVDRVEALEVLRGAVIEDGSPASPRLVRCAVLSAHRDVGRLRKQVAHLKVDWRDIIVEGEYVVRERKLMTQARWDETFSFDNLINPKFEQ